MSGWGAQLWMLTGIPWDSRALKCRSHWRESGYFVCLSIAQRWFIRFYRTEGFLQMVHIIFLIFLAGGKKVVPINRDEGHYIYSTAPRSF